MGSQTDAKPIRLAVLMNDTPLPQTRATFGNYGGVFTDLFKRAVAPAAVESQLSITTHDVVSEGYENNYPDLDKIDAILMTGSKHNSFDHEPWIEYLVAFVRKALATTAPGSTAQPVRVVGICFGHQIVGRALDCPVNRSPNGWEVSVTDVNLSPDGKAFFGQDTLKIHQMHRDAVLEYPAGAVQLAETTTCPVQGILIPKRVVTVQGHPEFTGTIMKEILESRHAAGIFTDDMFKSGMARRDNKHDGENIARAFIKFMREP